jgi:hypothetical protein
VSNRNRYYVPEWLLEEWSITVDPSNGNHKDTATDHHNCVVHPGLMSDAAKLQLGFDPDYGTTKASPPIYGERK